MLYTCTQRQIVFNRM